MNNNYDPNRQYQYQNDQFNEDLQSQQPLYEKNVLSTTTYLVLSILGLAFSTLLGMPIVGLILSIIAYNKGKTYFSLGGAETGEARAAKIMTIIGVVLGAVGTAVVVGSIMLYTLYMIFVALGMAGMLGLSVFEMYGLII